MEGVFDGRAVDDCFYCDLLYPGQYSDDCPQCGRQMRYRPASLASDVDVRGYLQHQWHGYQRAADGSERRQWLRQILETLHHYQPMAFELWAEIGGADIGILRKNYEIFVSCAWQNEVQTHAQRNESYNWQQSWQPRDQSSGGQVTSPPSWQAPALRAVAVCIVVKAPVPGQVKTRLCPPLSPAEAASLQSALLLDTYRAVAGLEGAQAQLIYTGDRTRFPEKIRSLPAYIQRGGDLGARIEQAMRIGLAQSDRAIVIGADLPALTSEQLRAAVYALDNSDVVLGPSPDGGFYLIAMRSSPPPGLLSGLVWSAPETYRVCAARLVQREYRLAEISSCSDVDTIEDLRQLNEQIKKGIVVAPETESLLSKLAWV